MGVVAAVRRALIGDAEPLPPSLAARWPELREVRYRRGGVPPRVAGWLLGESSVAAITLWRTIYLGQGADASAELLLHELQHVHQFEASRAFPVRYLWESVRRGYLQNRFEVEARRYAAQRLGATGNDSL